MRHASHRYIQAQRRRHLGRHDQHSQHHIKTAIKPTAKDSKRACDYRGSANGVELGAAQSKTAKDSGTEYLSIKIDDPPFPAPIYATLIQGDQGEYKFIWSR